MKTSQTISRTMNKTQLLEYLESNDPVDADQVADAMQLSYAAAAMALLRLVRQDLASRYVDPDTRLYEYELTPKGEARLSYFLEEEKDDER